MHLKRALYIIWRAEKVVVSQFSPVLVLKVALYEEIPYKPHYFLEDLSKTEFKMNRKKTYLKAKQCKSEF